MLQHTGNHDGETWKTMRVHVDIHAQHNKLCNALHCTLQRAGSHDAETCKTIRVNVNRHNEHCATNTATHNAKHCTTHCNTQKHTMQNAYCNTPTATHCTTHCNTQGAMMEKRGGRCVYMLMTNLSWGIMPRPRGLS